MTSQRSAARAAGRNGADATAADPKQLAQQIEKTRAQLGETVHALVAKTDVKARAGGAIRQATARLGGAAARAKRHAPAQFQSSGRAGQVKIGSAAGAVAAKVSSITPAPVQRIAGKAAGAAKKRPVPLGLAAVAAAVLVVAVASRKARR
jgi:Protein of unknown function (DUF3618)